MWTAAEQTQEGDPMRTIRSRAMAALVAVVITAGALSVGAPMSIERASAAGANAVTHWSVVSQNAVIVGRPAGSAAYLHAIALVAIHDAIVAIDGSAEALVSSPPVTLPADGNAAVAAAARDVLVARVPAQAGPVQLAYDTYVAGITDGPAKTNGIALGQAVADDVLGDRADDNFDVDPDWVQPPTGPGVFEPVAPTKPVDVKMGAVRPIAIPSAEAFMPGPPIQMTSATYAADFDEVKALGRKTGSTRTLEQTETALFWSENTVVQWNRTLIELAAQHGLDRVETARLLAMAFVSSADSLIVCLRAKYRYVFWRPVHAIQRADTDGNPATERDPEWQSLLVVNHPEYPSGHGCFSGAVIPAIAAFFGTNLVEVTVSSTVTGTNRTYSNLKAIARDVFMARIYSGLHFRSTMAAGFNLGKHVTRYVLANYFGIV
jgi:hypothetical protein